MTIKLPDFEAWAILAKVVETGSFSRAAIDLGLSKATASKAISRLETRLSISLFHRTSRRLTLTDIGRLASTRAARLLADGEAVEAEVCEQATKPSGPIRLAAPMSFGIGHLAPLLPEFLTLYPEISLDLNLSDQLIDVVGEGYDVVLRISVPADSSLRARRLCQVRRLLIGAPIYFDRYGRPRHPDDLKDHVGLRYSYDATPGQWRFLGPNGEEIIATPSSPLRVNNADVLRPTLLAGIGMAIQPEFLVWEDLAAGRLEVVMPDWSPPPIGLHLITPPSALRPARVELLIDFLSRHFATPPWAAQNTAQPPR